MEAGSHVDAPLLDGGISVGVNQFLRKTSQNGEISKGVEKRRLFD